MTRFKIAYALLAAGITAGFALPALADSAPQAPGMAESATGARPGNVIGTGESLPRGTVASNIIAMDTHSVIAPNLPSPPLGDSASPWNYLAAARAALAGGRTGETQQALEMASTRALDRVVDEGHFTASHSPLVLTIHKALVALAGNDRAGAQRQIEAAMTLAANTGA